MGYRILVVAAAIGAFAAACSDDESPPETPTATATVTTSPTSTPTATATPKLEPTQPPTPVITPGRKHVYDRGETVTVERGILFLDPATGGGVVWEGAAVSPSGMYVFWQDPQGQAHLVHSTTEAKLVIGELGEFPSIVGFSPDDTQFAAWTEDAVTIYETRDGSEVVRIALEPGTASTAVRWSDHGSVAVGMRDAGGNSLAVAVVAAGALRTFAAGASYLEWSPDGEWLAAVEGPDELDMVEVATGQVVPAAGSGSNPRWSANGHYLAVQADDFSTVRVFDREGIEVLRVSGMCAVLGTPWEGNELHSEFNDLLVAMDGSTRPAEPYTPGPVTSGWADGGGVEMKSSGTVVAELQIALHVLTSWPYGRDGIRSMTDDGRGVFVLGVGGRGFCEGVGDFSVELPRFD